jgi:hypothetical protein
VKWRVSTNDNRNKVSGVEAIFVPSRHLFFRTARDCEEILQLEWWLELFRNWCRPERYAFSWFSSKENHTSRSLSGHSNCELL